MRVQYALFDVKFSFPVNFLMKGFRSNYFKKNRSISVLG